MKRIALMLAVIASLFIAGVSPAAATDESPHKVFVCKYVGTPGVNERLQTGNNPISVDIASIKDFDGDDINDAVGLHFADAQGQSIVIAVDHGQPEPPITDCPPPTPDEPTPTPKDTPTPTPTPTATPTSTPTDQPTPTPVVTPTPTPTPTPIITPPPEGDVFSLEVCPDLAALIGGDTEDTVIATIPPGQSAIRFRAIGAILLIALHVRIDGAEVVPDGDGVVLVTPGVHAWSISDPDDATVLASGEIDCPVCGRAVTPPPNDVTNPPKHTLPPTDTADIVGDNASTNGILPILLVLGAISGGSLLLTRKRR